MEEKKMLGQLIKEAREEKGLTQIQLAKMSNVTEPSIRKYECGKRNPKINTVIAIAKALDKPISYFNIGIDETHQCSNEDYLLNFKKMSVEEIKQLIYECTEELIRRI